MPVAMSYYGLYDMYGNVWEWCHDVYEENYDTNAKVDPQGRDFGLSRVLRGGYYFPNDCRSAKRGANEPDRPVCDWGHRGGFRVVVSVE